MTIMLIFEAYEEAFEYLHVVTHNFACSSIQDGRLV